VVCKLALVFHEVRLHDHWKERSRGIWRLKAVCLRPPRFPALRRPWETRWLCVMVKGNRLAPGTGQGPHGLFCFVVFQFQYREQSVKSDCIV
jgi:hypothetical protein